MSTPSPSARRAPPALSFPIFLVVLTLLTLLGASIRAGAAPYAAMVMDARTGEVLHTSNADTRLHPASLTKMMTLYIAFEAVERGEIGLDDRVTISRKAAAEVPSKLGLRAGSQIELRYLIRAAAVKSANDAATAIGEAISGSEAAFARRMNRTAKALGMTRTTFKNAHGLTEDGHLSTARDMTILGRRLFYDYPEYYNLFSRRATSAKLATVYNTNRKFLAAYRGADGIKTGYTRAAGFNLVASAERGDKRVLATVFGGNSTASRNAEVARLLDLGFDRAPRYARVRKPAAPNYAAVGGRLDRGATHGAQRILAIRAVSRSLRPSPRPAPAAVQVAAAAEARQAALEDGIAAAVVAAIAARNAEAAARTEAAAEPREIAAALPPRPRPPMAGPEDLRGAIAAASGAPNNDMAGAESAADVAAADLAATGAAATGAAATGPDAPSAMGAAAAPPPAEASGGLGEAVARAVERAAPRAVSFLRSSPAPEPRPDRPADDASGGAVPEGALAVSVTQAAQGDMQGGAQPAIALASHQASQSETGTEKPAIVGRASTSGGRHWGITLGRYPTRFAAEKELLRTALAEMGALDGALRKVARDRGGFRANFVGMSEEQADIACLRLAARGRDCETLGPS